MDTVRRIINKAVSLVEDKEKTELRFQRKWREFPWQEVMEKLEEHWFSYRYMREIPKHLELDETKRILDVGCGVISVLNVIPGVRYGLDPLVEQYKRLYSLNSDITWVAGYGEDMPFEDSFFDIVFCSNVLDHTDSPITVLSEIKRVLKDKGRLVLTVDIFPDKKKRNKAHPHSLSDRDLERLLTEDFCILFDQMSSINAQVYNFMNGKTVENDYKERIIVAKTK